MITYTNERFIGKGHSIGIFTHGTQEWNQPHKHEFIEIVYVRAGEAVQWIDGQEFQVGRGDMLFINYGSEHAFQPRGEFSYTNVCFSPEVMGHTIVTERNTFALLCLTAFDEMRASQSCGKISFTGSQRQEIEQILDAMLEEYRRKALGADTVLESYMNILITKMLRKTHVGMEDAGLVGVWKELEKYIDENLHTSLTLSALAEKCFYNPSYFSRMFKQKFGMSLTEYVSRRRVEQAIALLRETDMSVDQISHQVGFGDKSTFYHTFSKITGAVPTDYRK